ncbi:MAG: metallophosphoesterase [Pseudomonadota bacterium]
MPKIIWMSDLHFSAKRPVQGYDTHARVRAAVRFILDHHPDAAACVITGDMADRGTGVDYRALQTLLSDLTMPVHPMVGNHDDRVALRAVFPLPQDAMDSFVQYRVDLKGTVLLCLDTQKAGSDAGAFCEARMAWLKAQLAEADGSILVFVHHPPMALGLPTQDLDCMQNGEAFLESLRPYRGRMHLCAGHVHRPVTGTYRGIAFTTARSITYQAPNPQPAWDWSSFHPAPEAPSLSVIESNLDGVIIQHQQFCDAALGAF